MEEEINDFDENFCEEVEETDEEYEFDASRFFDFTRSEYDWETEEAERWFEVSGDYEPAPFIVKLKSEKLFSPEVVPNASNAKSGENLETGARNGASVSKKNAEGKRNHLIQEKSKERSGNKAFQPRSSTLMKPTASHLAKQNKLHDHMDSNCFCTRSQRTSSNLSEKSFQSSVGFDNPETKRQKLEIGYLRKMAHLKHHISFLHKSSKKVTVPREPELETLLRAQRRSSKNSSASSENDKDGKKGRNFKALPLNRNILQAPSLPQIRKSTTQLTQSQMFRLKTVERANHHASAKASKSKDADLHPSYGATDSKKLNYRETSKQAKQETPVNFEAVSFTEKEPELPTCDQLMEVPTIEQFVELSLGSDSEENNVTRPERNSSNKENAENVPASFQPDFWKSHAKPNRCGGHLMVHGASWSNLNR